MVRFPYILIVALSILCACSARKKQEPAILEGKKIDVSSIYKKRGADLVDALYEELVNNSDSLRKLEKEIDELKAVLPDSLEDYKAYHEKNEQYYASAEKKADAITDTTLRNAILGTITKSRGFYRDSVISSHYSIDSLIQLRTATIDNLHNLLKIVSTLPVIEEFQQTNRPDTINGVLLMQRLDAVITRLDSLAQLWRPKPSIEPAGKK